MLSTDKKRPDTPLASTPESKNSGKVTDVASALSDIQKRADARKKISDEGQKKLNDARRARSGKGATQTGSGKLQGLASLRDTLGTQYQKKE